MWSKGKKKLELVSIHMLSSNTRNITSSWKLQRGPDVFIGFTLKRQLSEMSAHTPWLIAASTAKFLSIAQALPGGGGGGGSSEKQALTGNFSC